MIVWIGDVCAVFLLGKANSETSLLLRSVPSDSVPIAPRRCGGTRSCGTIRLPGGCSYIETTYNVLRKTFKSIENLDRRDSHWASERSVTGEMTLHVSPPASCPPAFLDFSPMPDPQKES